jgi:large subunit ribosomal protein L7/L12
VAYTEARGRAPEPEAFDLILIDPGRLKIQTIKLIRDYTNRDLKPAKDLVDFAPSVILVGVAHEEAERLRARFEAIGASAQTVASHEAPAAYRPSD